MSEQLAWDFTLLEEKPTYKGRAPMHFTTDYFTAAEVDDASNEARLICSRRKAGPWYPGRDFTTGWRHMWRVSSTYPNLPLPVGHDFIAMQADLRCSCYMVHPWGADTRVCYCVGDHLFKAQCTICHWQTIGSYARTVERWHDHAWPGWQELPVVPYGIRPTAGGISKKAKQAWAFISENYPPEWHIAGAPVITERSRDGSRHVDGYSPWDGFDMAAPQSHALKQVTPRGDGKTGSADCICGLRMLDRSHVGARQQIEDHVDREREE